MLSLSVLHGVRGQVQLRCRPNRPWQEIGRTARIWWRKLRVFDKVKTRFVQLSDQFMFRHAVEFYKQQKGSDSDTTDDSDETEESDTEN